MAAVMLAPGDRWFADDRPIRRVHADASMFVGGLRALLLQCFNLGLGLLVYWPFVRRYDRSLLAREQQGR